MKISTSVKKLKLFTQLSTIDPTLASMLCVFLIGMISMVGHADGEAQKPTQSTVNEELFGGKPVVVVDKGATVAEAFRRDTVRIGEHPRAIAPPQVQHLQPGDVAANTVDDWLKVLQKSSILAIATTNNELNLSSFWQALEQVESARAKAPSDPETKFAFLLLLGDSGFSYLSGYRSNFSDQAPLFEVVNDDLKTQRTDQGISIRGDSSLLLGTLLMAVPELVSPWTAWHLSIFGRPQGPPLRLNEALSSPRLVLNDPSEAQAYDTRMGIPQIVLSPRGFVLAVHTPQLIAVPDAGFVPVSLKAIHATAVMEVGLSRSCQGLLRN